MSRQVVKTEAKLRLGDRLESALKLTGIHQAVKEIERRTGWDCGCSRRTAALNRWGANRVLERLRLKQK